MKMTDYDDYENNLAFKPIGDWADTEPKVNTDRTDSTIELVNKIEKLNKWIDLKSEYIKKLNRKLFIAHTALRVLAKGGNEVAKLALEEMEK